jgi:hypothetical protein
MFVESGLARLYSTRSLRAWSVIWLFENLRKCLTALHAFLAVASDKTPCLAIRSSMYVRKAVSC